MPEHPTPKEPRRRLSSRTVTIGMVSSLSLFLVSCTSSGSDAYCDDSPTSTYSSPTGYPGLGSWDDDPTSVFSSPTSYPGLGTSSDDDDDDDCDRGGFGGGGHYVGG